MAEYWVHDKAAAGGDGLSIGAPLNAIPSNTFGNGHTWNLKYGSVFDFGAVQLTSGNNTLVRAYGDPADGNPWITGAHANLFNCDTASGAVTFEDISFVRSGAESGTGVNCTNMSSATTGITLRRCMIAGSSANIRATRTRKLTMEHCDVLGSIVSYGLRGIASLTIDCDNWRISNNTFECGVDIELYVSDVNGSNGSFNNLVIEDNRMQWSGPTPAGTSMFLRGNCNAIDWPPEASVAIDTPSPGVHTLTRHATGIEGEPGYAAAIPWPNWPNGTVIFLAGWSNAANFGTVTVTSGGNTTAVTVTNLGATLVNESASDGKGAGIRDPLRAFNNPIIRRNRVRNRGYTPIFIDNFRGGVLEANDFDDTVAVGQVSAAIEAFNCLGTVAIYNRIRGITGVVAGDAHGIFWDGACEDCIGIGNYISGLRTTGTGPFNNWGHGLALFHCQNCGYHSNIVEDCNKGSAANARPTTGYFYNNTFSGCDFGFSGSSTLPAGGIVFKNNVTQKCGVGIRDEGSSVVSTNAWWQNTVDNQFGAITAKDAEAITDDPMLSASLRPMPGSPLIGAGLYLGPQRDFSGVQRPSPPSVGSHDVAQLRNSP